MISKPINPWDQVAGEAGPELILLWKYQHWTIATPLPMSKSREYYF